MFHSVLPNSSLKVNTSQDWVKIFYVELMANNLLFVNPPKISNRIQEEEARQVTLLYQILPATPLLMSYMDQPMFFDNES